MDVSPTADVDVFTKLFELKSCSYVEDSAQISTLIPFAHVPAVLAAHSPWEPCPV